jgi:nucleoside-triphosphatase THEP1
MQFKTAVKSKARLRLGMMGPAGSGKTYTALAVAKGLAAGGRVAVIDTEHGSASKYADIFQFDVVELTSYEPAKYVEALQAAAAAGYDVVIVDSLSHAWNGTGGVLELVDRAAARSKSANTFGAWRDVTPEHNKLVEAILSCRCHVIATLRSKTEYVQERDASGRTVIRKVGLAPVQRDGLEYEFDLLAEITHEHAMCVTKSRIPQLDGAVITRAGAETGTTLRQWLDVTPAVVSDNLPEAKPIALATGEQLKALAEAGRRANVQPDYWTGIKRRFGVTSSSDLSAAAVAAVIEELAGSRE